MASPHTETSLDRDADRFEPLDPAHFARLNELHRFLEKVRIEERDAEQRRYGDAAVAPEASLCTPVDYGGVDLSHIPARVLDVDYGCGDPTRYAREGETVLDLGSGSGKHCFMIAAKVGATGRVVGIDKTPQMLELSRGAVDEVHRNLGYAEPNVEFRHGYIEDLRWDVELARGLLAEYGSPTSYADLQRFEEKLSASPLVSTGSIDLIVSNCVLNLVGDEEKRALFRELHRVLARGGRAVISDIVSDQNVPASMKKDEHLWTGCVSGAMRRDEFLDAFAEAGFYGIEELSSSYWQTVEGIQFHSVTLVAYKGKEGPCWETYRSAYYRGPFRTVEDDDGHLYPRGVAVPVCEKTAEILSREPYRDAFLVSEPLASESEKIPFNCNPAIGHREELPPEVRERLENRTGLASGPACGPGSSCC